MNRLKSHNNHITCFEGIKYGIRKPSVLVAAVNIIVWSPSNNAISMNIIPYSIQNCKKVYLFV